MLFAILLVGTVLCVCSVLYARGRLKEDDRFKTTYDLAKYAMDLIDVAMKEELAKGTPITFEFANQLADTIQKKHNRLLITVSTGSSALYCRHTVFITGSGQSWFTDNLIEKYTNSLL